MSKGNTTWTYTYDANGMRTSRTNGTTTYNYVYNGSQLVQMTVGSDTLYFTYGAMGPATVTWEGYTYYYVLNGQGDVTAILDEDGIPVVWYNWNNAWGYNPRPEGLFADTLGVLNPLRYRGYVYDQETGYYYLQSRYYDPEIGRFINADAFTSTGQGFIGHNMFAYCLNNPVNLSDCTGNIPTRKNTVAINDGGSGTSSLDLQALYTIMNKFSNSGFDFSNSISLRVTEFNIDVHISSIELALMGQNTGAAFLDAGVSALENLSKPIGTIVGEGIPVIGVLLKYVHYYNRLALPNGDYKVYVIDSIVSSEVYNNGASGCWNKTYYHTVTVIYDAINIEGNFINRTVFNTLFYTERVF